MVDANEKLRIEEKLKTVQQEWSQCSRRMAELEEEIEKATKATVPQVCMQTPPVIVKGQKLYSTKDVGKTHLSVTAKTTDSSKTLLRKNYSVCCPSIRTAFWQWKNKIGFLLIFNLNIY